MANESHGLILPIIRVYNDVMAILDQAVKNGDVATLVQYGPDPRITPNVTALSCGHVPKEATSQVVESVDMVSTSNLRIRTSPPGSTGTINHDMMPVRGHWIAFESGCVAYGAHGAAEGGVIVPYWPGGISRNPP